MRPLGCCRASIAPGVSDIFPGSAIRVVGHFNDPAARACQINLEGPVSAEPAQLFCREILVVTLLEFPSVVVEEPVEGSASPGS